jgi:lipopolysaccharide export system permease protein
MRLTLTLSAYVARLFFVRWCGVLLGVAFLIALFDATELNRITANSKEISFSLLSSMVLFKLPGLLEKGVPFTILFGAMLTFWQLNRHQEFVVARAGGISAWEFLLPAVFVTLIIGAVQIAIFGPLASTFMQRFELLINHHVKNVGSLASISPGGIWFRQSLEKGHYILHSAAIFPSTMTLKAAIIFRFDRSGNFYERIDASSGYLADKKWVFSEVRITGPQKPMNALEKYELTTDLTPENIQDSFASPETLSIWELPSFIEVLEKAGFSGVRHRIYLYTILIKPLLLISMVLFAGVFTLRQHRRGGGTLAITLGITTGFGIYFGSDLVLALGQSGHIPASLAAFSPAAIAFLVSTSLLFYREDG